MSSTLSLAQPAYTTNFMQTILQLVYNSSSSSYPQPTGYQVNVLSSGSTVDQTTNVKISGYGDQYTNDNEVTTVTFLATFSNTNSYQFNEVQFYTQINGQNNLEVADFIFTSVISKPSGYVLVLSISFSISTPLQYINAVQDALQLCGSSCSQEQCGYFISKMDLYFLPFSFLNFIFIYLLGITLNYLESLSNIQQQAEEWANTIQNCENTCANVSTSSESSNCIQCLNNAMSIASSNPIAIGIVAGNPSSLSTYLPGNNIYVRPYPICNGNGVLYQASVSKSSVNVVSQNQVELTITFSISETIAPGYAVVVIIPSIGNPYYTAGIFSLNINSPVSQPTFAFTITLSQS